MWGFLWMKARSSAETEDGDRGDEGLTMEAV